MRLAACVARVHPRATPRVHPRRSASKSKPNRSGLNAGAGVGAARRRNDFETTTETKSTTTIYDTSSPAADSLGNPAAPADDHRQPKPQTRRQPSINPLFVRSSTSNYAKPPTNKPRRTNRKTQARKRSKRIRHRRTCVRPASLQSAQPSSWDVFSYSVLSVENNLYLCTDVVLRHRALCGCCLYPRIFAKVVRLLSNIFRLNSQFAEYMACRIDKYKVS